MDNEGITCNVSFFVLPYSFQRFSDCFSFTGWGPYGEAYSIHIRDFHSQPYLSSLTNDNLHFSGPNQEGAKHQPKAEPIECDPERNFSDILRSIQYFCLLLVAFLLNIKLNLQDHMAVSS